MSELFSNGDEEVTKLCHRIQQLMIRLDGNEHKPQIFSEMDECLEQAC